jgi:excisionase family DNA binding protein
MNETYYSVDQISEMLNIHPKTIQRYIREGKLRASKIGKSWRVTGHDLSIFMESSKITVIKEENNNSKKLEKEIKVSSVIDIDVDGVDEALRIINTVTAAVNTNYPEYDHPALHAQYLESEYKVRVTIWGNILFAQAVIDLIVAVTEGIKRS